MPVPKTLPPVPALLCGVDEAGRGPLAGSVFAAAVVLDPARPIEGLADSKVLTEAARDRLAAQIRERALAWSVAVASVEEIDTINILRASLLAMRRAVESLGMEPSEVWTDGLYSPAVAFTCRAIVKGDSKVSAISAASILAKTHRDRIMREYAKAHPQYGWHTNVGYSTPDHLKALREHGPCPLHRRSFAPVAQVEMRF